MIKPDITFKEVQDPSNRWCSSGHVAPVSFRRSGPESDLEPVRFFRAAGKISGTFCEPCLVIANAMARQSK